ncbi:MULTISPECIES: hypothetical protein [Marinomonas]|uniref:Helix-hairpin-helix domain-containing protein n=1 Tax=Marinomonas arctica TaxID=383750 RepID=A0A7H1J688_9GAMM|nr:MULTISPECIES: hypothetical protein [Marinomonas]MCS7484990.1 hypothetical protein [Marinomonas sp. BSi20414]QNT06004.1 hypothetical protein IBG28_20615 [Marinomonas arctica]GGN19609.1 hypothetical protein GCM10011350_06190 [Marinomonas arctica]
MDSLNQSPQDTNLTLQGCGYRIENDRILIFVHRIENNRAEENLSGTLRLQLCAFPPNSDHRATNTILASTTIGEIKGQHFLGDCYYDLIFQQPTVGSWSLALQLSEWNGVDYTLCDSVYFENSYQSASPSSDPSATINKQEDVQAPAPKIPAKNENIKKNTIGYSDGYLAINKSKVDKLLNVKGVPKKVLEKLVSERPFQSEKAVLNVKGMGPSMLKKVLAAITV